MAELTVNIPVEPQTIHQLTELSFNLSRQMLTTDSQPKLTESALNIIIAQTKQIFDLLHTTHIERDEEYFIDRLIYVTDEEVYALDFASFTDTYFAKFLQYLCQSPQAFPKESCSATLNAGMTCLLAEFMNNYIDIHNPEYNPEEPTPIYTPTQGDYEVLLHAFLEFFCDIGLLISQPESNNQIFMVYQKIDTSEDLMDKVDDYLDQLDYEDLSYEDKLKLIQNLIPETEKLNLLILENESSIQSSPQSKTTQTLQ